MYSHQYLLGRRFIVRRDHQALVWLFKLREPKGRIARWIEILSQYDFSVEYRPGTKHQNAGAMSRFCNPRECMYGDEDMLEPLKCGQCSKCKRKSEWNDGGTSTGDRGNRRELKRWFRMTHKSEQSEHENGNITPTYQQIWSIWNARISANTELRPYTKRSNKMGQKEATARNIKLLWHRVLNWDTTGIFGHRYSSEKEYCIRNTIPRMIYRYTLSSWYLTAWGVKRWGWFTIVFLEDI